MKNFIFFCICATLLALSGCKPKGSDQGSPALTDGEIEQGRLLYAKNGCVSCHGERGMGDGPVGQALTPRPRNFRSVSEYKQGSSVDQIAKTIETGIPGSMMVAYPLSQADRLQIARFIVYLQQN